MLTPYVHKMLGATTKQTNVLISFNSLEFIGRTYLHQSVGLNLVLGNDHKAKNAVALRNCNDKIQPKSTFPGIDVMITIFCDF
jgi:hypothetical protein